MSRFINELIGGKVYREQGLLTTQARRGYACRDRYEDSQPGRWLRHFRSPVLINNCSIPITEKIDRRHQSRRRLSGTGADRSGSDTESHINRENTTIVNAFPRTLLNAVMSYSFPKCPGVLLPGGSLFSRRASTCTYETGKTWRAPCKRPHRV